MGISFSREKVVQKPIYNEDYVRPKPEEYITVLCFSFDKIFNMESFETEILNEAISESIIPKDFGNLSAIKWSHTMNSSDFCGALNYLVSFKTKKLDTIQTNKFMGLINNKIGDLNGKFKLWKIIQLPRNFMPHNSHSFREFCCVLPKSIFAQDICFLQKSMNEVVLQRLKTTSSFYSYSRSKTNQTIREIKISQSLNSSNYIISLRGLINDINLVLKLVSVIVCFFNQNVSLNYIEKSFKKSVKLPPPLPKQCCYFDHADYSAYMMVARYGLPPEKQNVNFTTLIPSMHQWCQENIMPSIEEFLRSQEFLDYQTSVLKFSE